MKRKTRRSAPADPCPVCYEPIAAGDAFAFPCAHVVCLACNEKLVGRHYLSCPTCREPRAGLSQRDVDAASSLRTAQDAPQRPTVEHEGRRFEVVFLRSEAEGSPFDVLQRTSGGLLGPAHLEEVALDGPLGRMVQNLLQPTDMGSFLASHHADTARLTAQNSRPRHRRGRGER